MYCVNFKIGLIQTIEKNHLDEVVFFMLETSEVDGTSEVGQFLKAPASW